MRYSLVVKTIYDKEIVININGKSTKYGLDEIDLFTSHFNNFDELVNFLKDNNFIPINTEIKSVYIRYKFKENDNLKNYSSDEYKRLDVIYNNDDIINITNYMYNQRRLGNSELRLNNDLIKDIFNCFMEKVNDKNGLIEILESNYINKYIKDYIINYITEEMTIDEITIKIKEQLRNYKHLRGIYLWLNNNLINSNLFEKKNR